MNKTIIRNSITVVLFLFFSTFAAAQSAVGSDAFLQFDEDVVNGTTGTPLGGFGCGGVKFNANNGHFAVMPTPPADAYDFHELRGAAIQLNVSRGGQSETVKALKAAVINGRPDDDAFWPLHRVNFGVTNGVEVRMTGYSPLDNEAYDNMHLPYALYEFTLTNTAKTPVDATLGLMWPADADSTASWHVAASRQGTVRLKAGKSCTLRYAVAWYNRTDPELGYYMNLYQEPKAIAEHGLKVFDRLKRNAEDFAGRMRASSLPGWLKKKQYIEQ